MKKKNSETSALLGTQHYPNYSTETSFQDHLLADLPGDCLEIILSFLGIKASYRQISQLNKSHRAFFFNSLRKANNLYASELSSANSPSAGEYIFKSWLNYSYKKYLNTINNEMEQAATQAVKEYPEFMYSDQRTESEIANKMVFPLCTQYDQADTPTKKIKLAFKIFFLAISVIIFSLGLYLYLNTSPPTKYVGLTMTLIGATLFLGFFAFEGVSVCYRLNQRNRLFIEKKLTVEINIIKQSTKLNLPFHITNYPHNKDKLETYALSILNDINNQSDYHHQFITNIILKVLATNNFPSETIEQENYSKPSFQL